MFILGNIWKTKILDIQKVIATNISYKAINLCTITVLAWELYTIQFIAKDFQTDKLQSLVSFYTSLSTFLLRLMNIQSKRKKVTTIYSRYRRYTVGTP